MGRSTKDWREAVSAITDAVTEIAELRRRAAELTQSAAALEKSVQAACAHPFASLSFHHSGVRHGCGHKTTHEMRIECSACGARLSGQLDEHND